MNGWDLAGRYVTFLDILLPLLCFAFALGLKRGVGHSCRLPLRGADYGHPFEWYLILQMRSGFIDVHRSLPFHRIVFVWIWRIGRDVIGISDRRFYCLVTIWHDFFIEMIFSLPNRGRERSDEQRTAYTALWVESSIPWMRNSSSADDPDADCGNPAISSFEFRWVLPRGYMECGRIECAIAVNPSIWNDPLQALTKVSDSVAYIGLSRVRGRLMTRGNVLHFCDFAEEVWEEFDRVISNCWVFGRDTAWWRANLGGITRRLIWSAWERKVVNLDAGYE